MEQEGEEEGGRGNEKELRNYDLDWNGMDQFPSFSGNEEVRESEFYEEMIKISAEAAR